MHPVVCVNLIVILKYIENRYNYVLAVVNVFLKPIRPKDFVTVFVYSMIFDFVERLLF